MKNLMKFTALLIVFTSLMTVILMVTTKADYECFNNLIRFHVIANSDSAQDQAVKIKVRDRIFQEFGDKLNSFQNFDETYQFVSQNLGQIEQVAKDELLKNNFNCDVKVSLEKSHFNAKAYSQVSLPAGEYNALRVVIGEGKGKNFFCVMFPPLCMNNLTVLSKADYNAKLKTVVPEQEANNLTSNKVIYKFKFLEFFKL